MADSIALHRCILLALAEVRQHGGLPPGDFETKVPGATTFAELVVSYGGSAGISVEDVIEVLKKPVAPSQFVTVGQAAGLAGMTASDAKDIPLADLMAIANQSLIEHLTSIMGFDDDANWGDSEGHDLKDDLVLEVEVVDPDEGIYVIGLIKGNYPMRDDMPDMPSTKQVRCRDQLGRVMVVSTGMDNENLDVDYYCMPPL